MQNMYMIHAATLLCQLAVTVQTCHSCCRGTWEVLDFGDVVVHVMSAEKREYYDLEGFYGAAEEVWGQLVV